VTAKELLTPSPPLTIRIAVSPVLLDVLHADGRMLVAVFKSSAIVRIPLYFQSNVSTCKYYTTEDTSTDTDFTKKKILK
jgi:hypothetical protein